MSLCRLLFQTPTAVPRVLRENEAKSPSLRPGLQILCMHGGLSPELKSLEQIKRVPRPTDVPDTGLLCDLLWADPDKQIQVRAATARRGGPACGIPGFTCPVRRPLAPGPSCRFHTCALALQGQRHRCRL